jgi:hypothetical protein
MLSKKAKSKLLHNCVNETVTIHYEDELFDKTVFTFENYIIRNETQKTIMLKDNQKELELDYDNIVKIETFLETEKRLSLIENSETLEEGLAYTSEYITDDEQVSLEILKEKLLPKSIERNLQLLKQRITSLEPSYKHVENVLYNLLLNICENGKVVSVSQNERVMQITDEEIKQAIKNYEEEIF